MRNGYFFSFLPLRPFELTPKDRSLSANLPGEVEKNRYKSNFALSFTFILAAPRKFLKNHLQSCSMNNFSLHIARHCFKTFFFFSCLKAALFLRWKEGLLENSAARYAR